MQAKGLESMPIFSFDLWSLIKDCLGPSPSHKASSVFDLGCRTHPLQSARKYPLKGKHAVGSGATEPSAPPYEDRFSHKIKIQSNDDSMIRILIQCQTRVKRHSGSSSTGNHAFGGSLHRPRIFLFFLQAALQAAHSQGEDTAGFKFYPVLERPDPNNPGMQQRFHEKIPFKTLKEVKQACTMYGSTMPFMLGLSQTVVGDTAMPPDDWTGLAKACLSPGDYLLWKTGFIEFCQEQANRNLAHGLHITADMLMGRRSLKA
jgi:hypothetical protein